MKQRKSIEGPLSQSERQLIGQLRQHPELLVQVQSILEIVRNEAGPLQTADEVEELLIEAMRRLGRSTMGQWAAQAEERVTLELKRQDPTVLSRKKKH